MILEKLGSLALLGLVKTAGLLTVVAPAIGAEAPEVVTPEFDEGDFQMADAISDETAGDLSAIDRSHIVTSLHDEAVASLDLASTDLADLKSALAGLSENASHSV